MNIELYVVESQVEGILAVVEERKDAEIFVKDYIERLKSEKPDIDKIFFDIDIHSVPLYKAGECVSHFWQ